MAAGTTIARAAGPVVITLGERTKTVGLVGGEARVVFTRVRPGSYQAVVSFAGSDVAAPASGSGPVIVR